MKEFLEKRWWLGIGALVAIALLVVAILQFAGTGKPEDGIKLVPERQRVFLPNENEMWRLNIDNSLLTELYGQAHGLAITKFQDAKLASLLILVHPYESRNRVSILFTFYSPWADRVCTYAIDERQDMHELGRPSEPAKLILDRVTFDELPWLKSPHWPQFVRKSWEKVGLLSPDERTYYALSTYALLEPQWSISFEDGVTGNEFDFSWDGKGDPIPKE